MDTLVHKKFSYPCENYSQWKQAPTCLYPFSFSSIKFEFGIDNTVNGRIKFAAAVDLTIFGKRLYLSVTLNIKNPAAAVDKSQSQGVEDYKV